MAKDITGQPWKFDATGQGEGIGPSLDSVSVNFPVQVYIDHIKVETGDGGDVLLYSRQNAGTEQKRYTVLSLDQTPSGDTLAVEMRKRVDGIYVETLPANAVLWVYHGEV